MNDNKIAPFDSLYHLLSTFFCLLVVMSNIISAKMVPLPFFQATAIPAGLLTYPLTFVVSDLVTEFFGKKRAREMVYMGLGFSLASLIIIQFALILPSADEAQHTAFSAVMGLSGVRIFASLTAFVISQLLDVQLYAFIRQWTGARFLWLRNNGSTCVSQLADTILVDMIYFIGGVGMGWNDVLPIIMISYAYKAFASVATTPILYLCVFFVRRKWPAERHQSQPAY